LLPWNCNSAFPFYYCKTCVCQQYKNVYFCHGNATSDFLCTVIHLKMFVLLLTLRSMRYYVCVCVCVCIYALVNPHLLCVVLSSVACLAVPYFSTCLINGMIFENKSIEHKTWVLIFFTDFVWNICRRIHKIVKSDQ
jgi:hypothetical protein